MITKRPFKKAKYEEQLLNEINQFLRKVIADSRLMFVSITRVELNKDYSYAKVYWDTFDVQKRGEIKKAIEGVTGKIRTLLAKVLKVRQVPSLTFVYDSQYESELEISKLLESETQKPSSEKIDSN